MLSVIIIRLVRLDTVTGDYRDNRWAKCENDPLGQLYTTQPTFRPFGGRDWSDLIFVGGGRRKGEEEGWWRCQYLQMRSLVVRLTILEISLVGQYQYLYLRDNRDNQPTSLSYIPGPSPGVLPDRLIIFNLCID